ncbi:HD domain-containing phosphohydrolase [Vibrio furnissii]|uniref:HD domain-containing phosphohydrolase n=1 Tax=Vibrio furnissii TaxID=29494 RepID=UPI000200DE5A|nr:HD domain-containing phosphohydrolase [Vibrio furnissii]ADT88859.1 response regulator receiver modulated metal dependent phosphohydrolase [Vibrio furnissii NCTC 11218]
MEVAFGSDPGNAIRRWASYLAIDQQTVDALREYYWIMEHNIDEVLAFVYDHLGSCPETAQFYQNEQSIVRARGHLRDHLMLYVFRGHFGVDYYNATIRIGQTHQRLGIDFKVYSGAYCIVMSQLARVVYQSLAPNIDNIHRYMSALNRAIFLDLGLATAVYYDTACFELEELAYELNFALAKAGEFRDNETGEHIKRISRMSFELAKALGQPAHWCKMIQIASPLHDVGKIGVPDEILLKPGKLDADEWKLMQQHPAIGGDIIPDNKSELIRMARRISLTHHEKWDGSGYPAGLAGEEIPLEGRIVAICDVFDALLSTRPYKRAWSVAEVVAYLRENRAKHFDPLLLDCFLEHLDSMLHIRHQFEDAAQAETVAD